MADKLIFTTTRVRDLRVYANPTKYKSSKRNVKIRVIKDKGYVVAEKIRVLPDHG